MSIIQVEVGGSYKIKGLDNVVKVLKKYSRLVRVRILNNGRGIQSCLVDPRNLRSV